MNSDKVIVFKSIINEVFGITKKKDIDKCEQRIFRNIHIFGQIRKRWPKYARSNLCLLMQHYRCIQMHFKFIMYN